ncbi:MAG: mRNA surveillance protein pelota [Candidatus Diapherotrites archaeon]
MRIVKLDKKDNFFEVVPENLDDLWHLERIIENGDLVSGSTERKIKPKVPGEKPFRAKMFIEVEAEGIEFHKFSGKLRVNGVITSGTPEEYVELKSHHTIEIEPMKNVKVRKKLLKNYQIERLEKAKKASSRAKMLLVSMDDEGASFALLKEYGLEESGKIFSGKQGKQYKGMDEGTKYFDEVLKKAEDSGAEKVVFAGPGFTKNNFGKFLEGKKKKFEAIFESSNSVGITGLNELVKNGVIDKIANELELSRETGIVEKFLAEIGKDSGLASYGVEEVKNAVNSGAVDVLLIGEKALIEKREELEKLMETAESLQAKVHIISSSHEAGKQLEGMGGVAAVLRYKLN